MKRAPVSWSCYVEDDEGSLNGTIGSPPVIELGGPCSARDGVTNGYWERIEPPAAGGSLTFDLVR